MAITNQQELQESVLKEFGRYNSDSVAHLLRYSQTWVDQLCDYPYWFLVISPDLSMVSEFPLSSDLSSLSLLVGNWHKSGWLRTTPGTSLYPIYAPFRDSVATQSSHFHMAKVRNLHYVKHFEPEGYYRNDLMVLESDMASIGINYGDQGIPTQVELRTDENGSYLHFYPVPDNYYLYQIQFVLASCPWFQIAEGDLRNRFLNYAPHAVALKFLMQMAGFYQEETLRDFYEKELKGDSKSGGGTVISMGKRGELGRLVEATRAKAKSLNNQVISTRKPGMAYVDPWRPWRNRSYF